MYTDNILAISKDAKAILNCLDQHYILKAGSIGPPTQYLGAQIAPFTLPGQNPCCSMSLEKYSKEAIRNIQNWLQQHNFPPLKSKAPSVLPTNYRPELDATDLCDDELHYYYMQQIGVLRWMVELGRINICTEVSMLAAFCAAPRLGHFNAMLHIFSFLLHHPPCRLVFDTSFVDLPVEQEHDWTEFYPNAAEAIPPNAPEPFGTQLQMVAFVDSDHAGDLLTRRSRTGVLIYLNRAPIIWFSKKQNSIESSIFGSEFMALKTGSELVIGLRYKLQ